MVRIIPQGKLGGTAIPSSLTTLSVSWLNNQFKAVAVHRGRAEGSWERPGESDGPGNFEAFIREAVEQTGYRGKTVSLVLAHPRLVQQVIDLPPVKGAALQKVIQRQAQQQKLLPGEAAWASQNSPSSKGMRVVLHLFPKLMLNQLILGCRRNGLDLTSVLPPAAVLQHQLKLLTLAKDQIVLLAGETGGSTTLVIGGGDGQILLARTLSGNWNEEPERLAVDLNRTLLFVSQQYGVAVNHGVWLFGDGAKDKCAQVQAHIQVKVQVSPVEYTPVYWAMEALKLRPNESANFIGAELQNAPQRRTFAKLVAAGTMVVVATSLALSGCFWFQARKEAAGLKTMSAQVTRLQARLNELQRLDSELTHQDQIARVVLGERPPPAAAWLLAYLGEAVPDDLVVTNLNIKREENLWRVKVAGVAQQGAKAPSPPSLRTSVKLLESRLSGAPFHVRFIEAEREATPAVKPGGSGNAEPLWLSRVTGKLTAKLGPARPTPEDHFALEGVMR